MPTLKSPSVIADEYQLSKKTTPLFPHQRLELHRLLTAAISGVGPNSGSPPDYVPRYMLEDCVFHKLEREQFSAWVQGHIKFYLTQKSYGFLNYVDPVMEQPAECFFHLSNCMVPHLVNYTDYSGAHHLQQDHEVIGMALRPLRYETRHKNVANMRQPDASEPCPYILSKGMRVVMLLYPNDKKGWYAGQWMAASHYEAFVEQATKRVQQRKQQIDRLPRYELVLETRTDSSKDWESLSENDCHRCTILETNQHPVLEKAWLSGYGRLSKHQRLMVVANRYDFDHGEWTFEVWTQFHQIKEAVQDPRNILPPFDLNIS